MDRAAVWNPAEEANLNKKVTFKMFPEERTGNRSKEKQKDEL